MVAIFSRRVKLIWRLGHFGYGKSGAVRHWNIGQKLQDSRHQESRRTWELLVYGADSWYRNLGVGLVIRAISVCSMGASTKMRDSLR